MTDDLFYKTEIYIFDKGNLEHGPKDTHCNRLLKT